MGKRRLVVIVGAGFSKSAGGPLLDELFGEQMMGLSQADPAMIARIDALLGQRQSLAPLYSIEDLFTELSRLAPVGETINVGGREEKAAPLVAQLRIHLASGCGAIRLDERTSAWRQYQLFFKSVLRQHGTVDVITFNYDGLVEQCLGGVPQPFSYGSHPEMTRVRSTWRTRASPRNLRPSKVLKLHGSADWGVCRGCVRARKVDSTVCIFDRPYAPPPRTRCWICKRSMLSVGLVPPTHFKGPDSEFLAPAWEDARGVLARADDLMVIGYSLPPADHEALALINRAVRSDRLGSITLITGSQPSESILGALGGHPGFENTGLRFLDYVENVLESQA